METLHQKCIVINIPCEEKKAWFSAYHELETSSTWKIQFYSKSSAHAEEEPDIDGIVTPEHLRQEVLESKKRRKLTHYYNDAAVVALKSNLSDQVPLWLNGLCVLSAYELFSGGVSSYPFIAENYSMSSDEAHQAVNTIAPIFLESAIILQDDWFMVTSINAFIHYNPSIDDCADFSHIMYQSIANAYIRRKRRFNNKFFKLSIRYGPLEFFATAGFHELCNITETVPFLSISIPDLPTGLVAQVNMPSSTNIYVTKNPLPVSKNRHLNQCLKSHIQFFFTNGKQYHIFRVFNIRIVFYWPPFFQKPHFGVETCYSRFSLYNT